MNQKKFNISTATIWISSLFLGVLSSVPQLASHEFSWAEATVNAGLTATFAVLMWYLNIYLISKNNESGKRQSISYTKLMNTLALGMLIMFCLAWLQQLILSHINFGPTMLMVEVRGILINLVCYMFLNLVQKNYENQDVNMELERVRNDNLSAQYDMLKQQVNPHFLFNSLNTLKAMVETKEEKTVDFIINLSSFYRFTLESRKLDLIHLSEEMEILDAYLFLQKARFEDGFTFESNISSKTLQTLIPPFTLQLLVENCLKHNVVSRSKPLSIRIYEEAGKIIVENPIQRKIGEINSLGVGLSNIEQRYKHLQEQPIEIFNDQSTFKIKLPLIHEYSNN